MVDEARIRSICSQYNFLNILLQANSWRHWIWECELTAKSRKGRELAPRPTSPSWCDSRSTALLGPQSQHSFGSSFSGRIDKAFWWDDLSFQLQSFKRLYVSRVVVASCMVEYSGTLPQLNSKTMGSLRSPAICSDLSFHQVWCVLRLLSHGGVRSQPV